MIVAKVNLKRKPKIICLILTKRLIEVDGLMGLFLIDIIGQANFNIVGDCFV